MMDESLTQMEHGHGSLSENSAATVQGINALLEQGRRTENLLNALVQAVLDVQKEVALIRGLLTQESNE